MKTTTAAPLRLGLVGCGAVAPAHLEAALGHPQLKITALADKARPRAEALLSRYGGVALDDHRRLEGQVDVAIVAVPHRLHAPVAIDLLERGIHVLVEKPMATTTEECDAMLAAAERHQRVLAVGHLRRLFQSSQWVKRLLERGMLGRLRRFDVREGTVYRWPAASDFQFRREAGGGVLADQGAHTLDLVRWWLGKVEHVEYRDDAAGGAEADCELDLQFEGGVRGIVELSRTRELRNTILLEGELGLLEIGSSFDGEVRLRVAGGDYAVCGHAFDRERRIDQPPVLFEQQLADFVRAAQEGTTPYAGGTDARATVALMEACRQQRQPLELEWQAMLGQQSDAYVGG